MYIYTHNTNTHECLHTYTQKNKSFTKPYLSLWHQYVLIFSILLFVTVDIYSWIKDLQLENKGLDQCSSNYCRGLVFKFCGFVFVFSFTIYSPSFADNFVKHNKNKLLGNFSENNPPDLENAGPNFIIRFNSHKIGCWGKVKFLLKFQTLTLTF